MNDTVLFDQALALVLKLSPEERLQLIEQVTASVAHKNDAVPPTKEHWGKNLNALLDSLDMSDWEALEIDDPVEWVEQQRTQERTQRLGDWGDTE